MIRKNIIVVLLGIVFPMKVLASGEMAISKGVQWLKENQSSDGFWGIDTEYPNLTLRDTSLVISTLCYLGTANTEASNGINWLALQDISCSRQLARKIKAYADFGTDTSVFIGTLTDSQNPDGGWGTNKGFQSTPFNPL
jgi:hypothetical protein